MLPYLLAQSLLELVGPCFLARPAGHRFLTACRSLSDKNHALSAPGALYLSVSLSVARTRVAYLRLVSLRSYGAPVARNTHEENVKLARLCMKPGAMSMSIDMQNYMSKIFLGKAVGYHDRNVGFNLGQGPF